MTNTCRSCAAPILWVVMESGKRMPLDATPTRSGNIIIRHGPRRGDVVGVVEPVEEGERRRLYAPPGGDVAYTSHFATCPQAGKWRRET